jgi:hypothetical protein
VTSVAAGSATITATSGSLTATATVTINRWASVSNGGGGGCSVTTQDVPQYPGDAVTPNSGDAYCWGKNDRRQIGDGTTTDRLVPTLLQGSRSGTAWKAISRGNRHNCGISAKYAGNAYCWGNGEDGALGIGILVNQGTNVMVHGGHRWDAIAAGGTHTCGITTDDEAYCWGGTSLTYGQLGDGTTTQRLVPTIVSGGHAWASISVGSSHTCGVTTAGDTYCWGRNNYGGLGDGTTTDRTTPTLVSGGHTWESISAGTGYTCGVTTADAAYCWGDISRGRLGDGSTGSGSQTTPTLVSGSHSWKSISAGDNHTCAVTTADAGYCWGWNPDGELGNDARNEDGENTPQLVSGSHTWSSIDTGWGSSGVTTAGVAYSWGLGDEGRLGNGGTVRSLVPTKITLPW